MLERAPGDRRSSAFACGPSLNIASIAFCLAQVTLVAEGRGDEAAKVQARFERAWRAADVKLDAAAL